MMAGMKTLQLIPLRGAWAAAILLLLPASLEADEFTAAEHQRQAVYHSPQKPGFTSWVGAWLMPDGSVMTSFTQATGPLKDRRAAPKDVQGKLNWPPKGSPGYDMTGLELKNIHLRSTDTGKTWKQSSADSFQSCMNGVTGEAEAALADGTILRGVFGFYLPYDDVPKTGYLQRSTDGSKTWGKPEVLLDPKKYTAWPRRIRVLRDGRIIVLMGVAPLAAGSHTREELGPKLQPMLVVSSDQGKTWQGPIPAVPKEKPDGWTEGSSTWQNWRAATCSPCSAERTTPNAGRVFSRNRTRPGLPVPSVPRRCRTAVSRNC
jgi:hypothetical protein